MSKKGVNLYFPKEQPRVFSKKLNSFFEISYTLGCSHFPALTLTTKLPSIDLLGFSLG